MRGAVGLPVLRKDFIIDEAQIIESRAWGASAVLLIARALERGALVSLAAVAREWAIEPLVEVRTGDELAVALEAEARVIGVNSRDLETLEVNPGAAYDILARVPPGVVAVAESGIRTAADVERAAGAGADAVLVGTSLSESADGAAAVRALAGVARRTR